MNIAVGQIVTHPQRKSVVGGVGTEIVLLHVLEPLSEFYNDETTVEVRTSRPGKVVVDRRGEGKIVLDAPDITLSALDTICTTLSNRYHLNFDADANPSVSCVLPGKHRFECLMGASVQTGLSLAIRCKHPFEPTWEQLGVTPSIRDYLLQSVDDVKTIIISGTTNTGKTTLINKMLLSLPPERRVGAVEDTPELFIDHFWDGVGLLAERETSDGSGMLNYRRLFDHKMRISLEQIVFGEISTLNASAFLAALISGADGMMCTIHGSNPHQVIHRKFQHNVAWSGEVFPNISELLMDTVDAIVHIKRSTDGWRRITDIYEPKNDRFVLQDGKEIS